VRCGSGGATRRIRLEPARHNRANLRPRPSAKRGVAAG